MVKKFIRQKYNRQTPVVASSVGLLPVVLAAVAELKISILKVILGVAFITLVRFLEALVVFLTASL